METVVSLRETVVRADFYEVNKTTGVYGLRDPDTGLIRYVGESEHIEKRYAQHINGARTGWVKGGSGARGMQRDWVMGLRSRGLRPELVILRDMPGASKSELLDAEAQMIAIYEDLTDGADLNLKGTEGPTGAKWRKFLQKP